MTIGKVIRMYREMRRMTQDELAEKSGITQSYISRLERDKAQATIEDIKALAKAMGLSPIDLIKATEQEGAIKPVNVPSLVALLREASFTPSEIEQVVLFLHALKPMAMPLRWAWDQCNAPVTT